MGAEHLTPQQLEALRAPLQSKRVKQDQGGNAYLEAWDIRAALTRCFGYGGWDEHLTSCKLIFERETTIGAHGGSSRPGVHVCYLVVVRLTIRHPDGTLLCEHECAGTGDATMGLKSSGDAHDTAVKSASSAALKRCAINLGTMFGLSLYDDGSLANVEGWSAVYPKPEEEKDT